MPAAMPAPVPARAVAAVTSQPIKTGLLPMRPETQHAVTIAPPGGAPMTVHAVARNPDDVRGAKTHAICLHPNCKGQTWPTVEAMVDAHPLRSVMAKRGEAHVFGLWSDDAVDPEGAKKAEADIKAADAKIKAKPDDEKHVEKWEAKKGEAEGRLEAASAVIGLIAPPDTRDDA